MLDWVFEEYKLDVLIHLAAESNIDRSINGQAAFIETVIFCTYTLQEPTCEYRNTLQEC